MTISELRQDYLQSGLYEEEIDPDPIAQFLTWFKTAETAGVPEPNAMTISTATRHGSVSARIVLLKGVDERGFVFYTNYESQKGRELAENPRAALTFYWPGLARQVRVTGTVERVSREESRDYFESRPLLSQIGALASRQSTVLPGRAILEAEFDRLQAEYAVVGPPLPDDWGGYRVIPAVIEFWQGRPSRLHDRLRYTREPDGAWRIERLSP